mmetsp:Transcript_75370/g.196490  ORF Transcript_75370/g.196490 Transcript_75370/m.196490 type:complete len:286 (+) Transcript_75370:495-1352(+)
MRWQPTPANSIGWPPVSTASAPQESLVCCEWTTLPALASTKAMPLEWEQAIAPAACHTSIPVSHPKLPSMRTTSPGPCPEVSHCLITPFVSPLHILSCDSCRRALTSAPSWGPPLAHAAGASTLRPSGPSLDTASTSLETLPTSRGRHSVCSARGQRLTARTPRVWRRTIWDMSSIGAGAGGAGRRGRAPTAAASASASWALEAAARQALLNGVFVRSQARNDSPGCGVHPADCAVSMPTGEIMAMSLTKPPTCISPAGRARAGPSASSGERSQHRTVDSSQPPV